MRRIIICLVALFAALVPSMSQTKVAADDILGEYLVPDAKNGDSKVRFTKNQDGTFNCQVFWLEKPIDPSTGKPWLDYKNPDKSLRSRRTDSVVLIKGLKFNAGKKVWDGTKVYDPNRGISANVTCTLQPDGSLQVRGSVMGIGETQTWIKQ